MTCTQTSKPATLTIATTIAALIVLASPAIAQRSRPKTNVTPDQLAPKQPSKVQSAGTKAAPVPSAAQSPFLRLDRSKSLTCRVRLGIRHADLKDKNGMPAELPFSFEEATVVFPILDRTASSHGSAVTEMSSTVKVGDLEFPEKVTVKTAMNSGARFGYWHIPGASGNSITFTLEYPILCFDTIFDEEAALKVAWPEDRWPAVCESTFEPQLYLDYGPGRDGIGPYETELIDQRLDSWLRGQDPKTIQPVLLAKMLAGEVQKAVQVSNEGLNFNKNGELEGIDLRSPDETLSSRRGSQFEISALLAVAYRRAGLPARIVVGFDVGNKETKVFDTVNQENKLRAWTEFALWDNDTKTLTWVPVDVPRMRKSSSRPSKITRTWTYFGTHDELRNVVPIAHHFHPPAPINTRAYGSPAFYGLWFRPDAPGIAIQHIRFNAFTTPMRAKDKDSR